MIVRIQGEGQWELAENQVSELNRIDDEMVDVIKKQDNARFQTVLGTLLDHVRSHGRGLRPEEIRESDLILPPSDATADDVARMFTEEGLIPG